MEACKKKEVWYRKNIKLEIVKFKKFKKKKNNKNHEQNTRLNDRYNHMNYL